MVLGNHHNKNNPLKNSKRVKILSNILDVLLLA